MMIWPKVKFQSKPTAATTSDTICTPKIRKKFYRRASKVTNNTTKTRVIIIIIITVGVCIKDNNIR